MPRGSLARRPDQERDDEDRGKPHAGTLLEERKSR